MSHHVVAVESAGGWRLPWPVIRRVREARNLSALLLQILPVAVAITINPVPITAALIMPATRRPAANGVAYCATLAIVMAAFGAALLLLLHGVAPAGGGRIDLLVHIAWLLVGLGFLSAFAVMVARKPAPDGRAREPRWMRKIEGLGPAGAAVVGLLLVNYEMEAPALMDILGAGVPRSEAFFALAVFIAVGCSLPVLLVVASIVARRRVASAMEKAKSWLAVHDRPILLALFGVIGVLYTVKGLFALV